METEKYSKVCLSFEAKTLAWIENTRGLIPRSTFVNDLIKKSMGGDVHDSR